MGEVHQLRLEILLPVKRTRLRVVLFCNCFGRKYLFRQVVGQQKGDHKNIDMPASRLGTTSLHWVWPWLCGPEWQSNAKQCTSRILRHRAPTPPPTHSARSSAKSICGFECVHRRPSHAPKRTLDTTYTRQGTAVHMTYTTCTDGPGLRRLHWCCLICRASLGNEAMVRRAHRPMSLEVLFPCAKGWPGDRGG